MGEANTYRYIDTSDIPPKKFLKSLVTYATKATPSITINGVIGYCHVRASGFGSTADSVWINGSNYAATTNLNYGRLIEPSSDGEVSINILKYNSVSANAKVQVNYVILSSER